MNIVPKYNIFRKETKIEVFDMLMLSHFTMVFMVSPVLKVAAPVLSLAKTLLMNQASKERVVGLGALEGLQQKKVQCY